MKMLLFDVVEFNTMFNAILGRPALTKFIVETHYMYQCLKMLGPKDVITVSWCMKTALICGMKSLLLAKPKSNKVKTKKDKVVIKPT